MALHRTFANLALAVLPTFALPQPASDAATPVKGGTLTYASDIEPPNGARVARIDARDIARVAVAALLETAYSRRRMASHGC